MMWCIKTLCEPSDCTGQGRDPQAQNRETDGLRVG